MTEEIKPDLSKMSLDELNTALDTIGTLIREENKDPDRLIALGREAGAIQWQIDRRNQTNFLKTTTR